MKDPRSKIQDPEKIQDPSTKPGLETPHLWNRNHESGRLLPKRIIGSWRLDLLWILDLGSWIFLLLLLSTPLWAQDRLKTMPGYEHHERLSREMTNAVKLGILTVTWTNEGKALDYQKDGKRYHYDIAARLVTELPRAKTN